MSDQINGGSAPVLANAGVASHIRGSYRNVGPSDYGQGLEVPTLPPRPEYVMPVQSYGMNQYNYSGAMGLGSYGMTGMGGMGGYGYGGYGGGYGMGGMGMGMNSYGGYNRMGGQNLYGNGDIESRFIQMAEENSRPAFESISSLVQAVAGVSLMLENTFFALTSSFRAILGVAENFGRLRSLFSQFWTTFGVLRSINWLIRKLSVMLGIRTESEFKAWAEAVAATQVGTATPEQRVRGSSWPVWLFFGVIAAAPYIILKMMNGITNGEILSDPRTWKNAMRAVALHAFQAGSPQELSFNADQVLLIAPQTLQGSLWNSGWVAASTDGSSVGLVPVNYLKIMANPASLPDKGKGYIAPAGIGVSTASNATGLIDATAAPVGLHAATAGSHASFSTAPTAPISAAVPEPSIAPATVVPAPKADA